MNLLRIVVEDIDAIIAAGYTAIRVYTDTTETGTFTTLDGSVTLVADTPSYQYTDTDGTAATWYKTAYFGATPGEGTQSDARKGETSAAYGTVDELREQVKATSSVPDEVLGILLDGATQQIDRITNRPLGFVAPPTATVKVFSGSGDSIQYIDECVSITSVAVKDSSTDLAYTAWASTDYITASGPIESPDYEATPITMLFIDPNGDYTTFTSGYFTGLRGFRRTTATNLRRPVPTVQITARWGYATSPPPVIKTACIAQAARWWQRGKGPGRVRLGNPN